jgi:DNA-binding transcriptional LysR family regulator
LYFTDRGIEELEERRGADQVTFSWLAERLRDFVDEHPDAESTVDSLASWIARLDDDADE